MEPLPTEQPKDRETNAALPLVKRCGPAEAFLNFFRQLAQVAQRTRKDQQQLVQRQEELEANQAALSAFVVHAMQHIGMQVQHLHEKLGESRRKLDVEREKGARALRALVVVVVACVSMVVLALVM